MPELAKILVAFDHARRSTVEPGFDLRSIGGAVCHFPRGGGEGFVSCTRVGAEDHIDSVIAAFDEASCEFVWKVYAHDGPSNLRELLSARGFEIGEPETVMVMPLADAQSQWSVPPEIRVERVRDPAGLADCLVVVDDVWDRPEWGAYLADQIARDPGRMVVYVAYDGATPASCGRASFPDGSPFAGLWSGGTRAAHRGRGLYRALVAARVRDAAERGFEYVTADAVPASRRILERLGFACLTTTWPCRWSRKL